MRDSGKGERVMELPQLFGTDYILPAIIAVVLLAAILGLLLLRRRQNAAGGGKKGAAAGCISVPTRYVPSVIEMIHPKDVQASIDLLAAMIKECRPDQFKLR